MRFANRLRALSRGKQFQSGARDNLCQDRNGAYYMSFEGQYEVTGLKAGRKTNFRIWYDPRRMMIYWGESPKSPTPYYHDVIEALRYFLEKLDSDERTKDFRYATDPDLDTYIDSKDVYKVTARGMDCSTIGADSNDCLVSPCINCYGKYQVARATLPALLEALQDFIEGPEE